MTAQSIYHPWYSEIGYFTRNAALSVPFTPAQGDSCRLNDTHARKQMYIKVTGENPRQPFLPSPFP